MSNTATMTIDEFASLIKSGEWTHKEWVSVEERTDRLGYDDDGQKIDVPCYWGWASVTSKCGDITVTYQEQFSGDEYDPETFGTTTDNNDWTWRVDGVIIVDEDGAPVTGHDIGELIKREGSPAFSAIDYGQFKIKPVTSIDCDDIKYEDEIRLTIDNAPDIRFRGELLAHSESSPSRASLRYSDTPGRWKRLALYRTTSKKYICHITQYSNWPKERDRHVGKVCDTESEVIDFFGLNWLSVDIYNAAGIEIG